MLDQQNVTDIEQVSQRIQKLSIGEAQKAAAISRVDNLKRKLGSGAELDNGGTVESRANERRDCQLGHPLPNSRAAYCERGHLCRADNADGRPPDDVLRIRNIQRTIECRDWRTGWEG